MLNSILEAVKLMRRNDVVKKNLQRLSKQPDSTTELSHQEKLKDLIAEKRNNLKLMLVSADTGIKGN
jgi:hypothetical protein